MSQTHLRQSVSVKIYTLVTIGLVVAGMIHLGLWLVADQLWEGAVSLRKPALFGISTGVTLLSLILLLKQLQPRSYDASLLMATAVAAGVEVFLISLQYWRGVASHFNHATPFDLAVHLVMDACVFVLTLAIANLMVRSFGNWNAPRQTQVAYQQGLVLLFVSCLIGFLILGIGFVNKSKGLPPEIYFGAGVLKFPHGIAIHAVQYLTVLAWALHRVGSTERLAARLVMSAAIGFWGQLLFSLLQTFQGRGRFELTQLSGLILVASTLLIVGPIVTVMLRFFRRLRTAA